MYSALGVSQLPAGWVPTTQAEWEYGGAPAQQLPDLVVTAPPPLPWKWLIVGGLALWLATRRR
jgi:hypothetical protein